MRRKILGSVQADMTTSAVVIIIQVFRIVLTNSFLCGIILVSPLWGRGFRPLWFAHHQRIAVIKAASAITASIIKSAISLVVGFLFLFPIAISSFLVSVYIISYYQQYVKRFCEKN